MPGKNPRKPKAVEQLIADAQQRQADNAVIAFIKGIRAEIAARNASHGGGTRKKPRK
jgi:hypothetical protein